MSMAESTFSDNEIIRQLSARPRNILDGVISVDESKKLPLSSAKLKRQSSLGSLDRLPLEVLHESFLNLSLLSLWRFSRVSWRGKVVVESFPAYQHLARSTGYLFEILRQAEILRRHSSGKLYKALRSERCVCCGEYGAFLLLIPAERCCFACLVANQALWMISLPTAQKCFGLTKRQASRLPVLKSIPGSYNATRGISRQRPTLLTTVRAAKSAALRIHGTIESLEMKHPLNIRTISTDLWVEKMIWYRQAPSRTLPQSPININTRNRRFDDYGGMGAVPFPSLLRDGIEWGLWCRGCRFTWGDFSNGEIDPRDLRHLVSAGCDTGPYLDRMRYRAWLRADFLQHSKQCYSAQAVMQGNV